MIKTKKCPKILFTLVFCNKGMEKINLNKIFKFKGSVACLAGKIQIQENISVATYRVTPTVRNKILNYKETVQ